MTPSGTSLSIAVFSHELDTAAPAERFALYITPSTGSDFEVLVTVPDAEAISRELDLNPESKSREKLPRHIAIASMLDAADSDGFRDESRQISLADVAALWNRAPASNRDVRRLIARLAFESWAREDLRATIRPASPDMIVTGTRYPTFIRNIQLLEEEGYVRASWSNDYLVGFSATARLIREVELFGAARADVVSERDYGASIESYSVLDPHRESLMLERVRYDRAVGTTELISVFRSVAPTVEAVLAEVLRRHGAGEFTSLGPMIGALQQRQLGDRALWSQLGHVHKFARDLAEHGSQLPTPALRIASENAFELLPQIAALAL